MRIAPYHLFFILLLKDDQFSKVPSLKIRSLYLSQAFTESNAVVSRQILITLTHVVKNGRILSSSVMSEQILYHIRHVVMHSVKFSLTRLILSILSSHKSSQICEAQEYAAARQPC